MCPCVSNDPLDHWQQTAVHTAHMHFVAILLDSYMHKYYSKIFSTVQIFHELS